MALLVLALYVVGLVQYYLSQLKLAHMERELARTQPVPSSCAIGASAVLEVWYAFAPDHREDECKQYLERLNRSVNVMVTVVEYNVFVIVKPLEKVWSAVGTGLYLISRHLNFAMQIAAMFALVLSLLGVVVCVWKLPSSNPTPLALRAPAKHDSHIVTIMEERSPPPPKMLLKQKGS